MVAVVANLVFKAGVCVWLGSPHLRRLMLIAFGVNAAAGILLVLLWPAA